MTLAPERECVPASDGRAAVANGVEQKLVVTTLRDIRVRSRGERVTDHLRVRMTREHDDGTLAAIAAYAAQQVDARASLQLEIEHQYVGLVFNGARDHRFHIGGSTDAFEVRFGRYESHEQGSEVLVVFGNQHSKGWRVHGA